eukprot:5363008-Amphidinium_carterae.1
MGFLEHLGVFGSAAVLDLSLMTSPCLQALEECGAISSTGAYGGSWVGEVTNNSNINFIDSFNTGATGTGIDVPVDATTEMSPLRRAEWIKFIAAFFNREPEANVVFKNISDEYHALRDSVANENLAMPKVAFVSYSSWQGVSSWTISDAGYKVALAEDAGAEATSGAFYSSAADAKAHLLGVDVVIDESYTAVPVTYNGTAELLQNFNFTEADISSGDFPFLSSN